MKLKKYVNNQKRDNTGKVNNIYKHQVHNLPSGPLILDYEESLDSLVNETTLRENWKNNLHTNYVCVIKICTIVWVTNHPRISIAGVQYLPAPSHS